MSAQFTSAQIDALFSQDVNIRLHAARQLEIVRFGGLEDLDHEEYLMATADWLARNGDVTALPQLQRLLGQIVQVGGAVTNCVIYDASE